MSRFSALEIEVDPINQPAASDETEKATWSAFRLRIAGRNVTRVWDTSLQSERAQIYIPVFPVVDWLVRNWWALLNEPCRGDAVPPPDADEPDFSWTKRHCFRGADSGTLLPILYIFNDEKSVRAVWCADEPGITPSARAKYIDEGQVSLDGRLVEASLSQFVNDTLKRVAASKAEHVLETKECWVAIQAASKDEEWYCRIAGRLGLDPYDDSSVGKKLSAFLVKMNQGGGQLFDDLSFVSKSDSMQASWDWVRRQQDAVGIRKLSVNVPQFSPLDLQSPHKFGYFVANKIRAAAKLLDGDAVDSIEKTISASLGARLMIEDRNHVPDRSIRSLAGWRDDQTMVIAGPQNQHESNSRFAQGRAVFHALNARGVPRLVTDGFTWDQQASRAFAAELLLPRATLKARVDGWADAQQVADLASEFRVSTMVVQRQLENAGIAVEAE